MTAGIVNPDRSGSGAGGAVYRFLRSIPTWVLWLLVVVWSIPTVGLLINSVRTRDQQRSSGWWTVFRDIGDLTLDNYRQIIGTTAAGGMKQGLTNSFAIALPACLLLIHLGGLPERAAIFGHELPQAPASGLTVPIDPRPIVTGERVVRGSSYGSARTREDLPRLVRLYQAGRPKIDQLITRRYALEEANEAFHALAAGELARGLIVF